MSTISAGDLTLLQANGHRANLYMSISRPKTLLSAQVNNASIEHSARDIAYDNGAGTYSGITKGNTLWVGSSAGLYDVGRVRIKSITGSATSGTITIAQNSIDWADDLYLTVKYEFPLYSILPRAQVKPEMYWKDYDVTYTDENTYPPPVAIAGFHRAGFVEGGSLVFNLDASDSYPIAPNAAISTYAWSCTAGIIASATSATTTLTFTTTNGDGEVLTLTVTDDNGKSQTTRRYVFPHSPNASDGDYPITDFEFDSVPSGSYSKGGWETRVKVYDSAGISDFPDEALVVIWQESWYGDTKKNISMTNEVVFAGYILSETINTHDGLKSTSFTIATIEELLKRRYLLSFQLNAVDTPSQWYEYIQTLTITRMVHHYFKWHSTLFEVADVFLPIENGLIRKYVSFGEGNMYSNINTYSDEKGIFARMICNKAGQVYCKENIQMISDARRAATTVIAPITEKDRADDLVLLRTPLTNKKVAIVELYAGYYPGTGKVQPFNSLAPGKAFETSGTTRLVINGTLVDSQAESNRLAGRILADNNNTFKDIRIKYRGNYAGYLDIVPQEWWTISLDTDDTNRGVVWADQKIVPTSVTMAYSNGYLSCDAVFEKDATGADGVTGDYPDETPVTGGDGTTGELAIVTASSANILKSDDTAWTEITTETTDWIEIDPFWFVENDSLSADDLIYIRTGNGFIKISYDGGVTETDITPTIDPPNSYGDSVAPTVADLDYTFISFNNELSGTFYIACNWQNASGDNRYWVLKSSDRGVTWQWVEWWLAEGIDPSDIYGAYNATGADDYADSLVNRNNPGTADLTTGVAPSWDSVNGWQFDGGTTYLVSGKQPVDGMTVIVLTSVATSSISGYIVGANDAAEYYYKILNSAGSSLTYMFYHNSLLTSAKYYNSESVISVLSGSDLSRKIYKDGTLVASSSTITATTISYPIYIGANNNAGVVDNFYTDKIKAIAIYNTELSAAQVATISANMAKVF